MATPLHLSSTYVRTTLGRPRQCSPQLRCAAGIYRWDPRSSQLPRGGAGPLPGGMWGDSGQTGRKGARLGWLWCFMQGGYLSGIKVHSHSTFVRVPATRPADRNFGSPALPPPPRQHKDARRPEPLPRLARAVWRHLSLIISLPITPPTAFLTLS